jgi:hypothetical protein
MTTFHHVWFIPVCLYIVSNSDSVYGFSWNVYKLSAIMTLVLAILGKFSAPKEVIVLNTHTHAKKDTS